MLPHFIFIHAFKEIKVLFCPFLFLNTATFLKKMVFFYVINVSFLHHLAHGLNC